MECRNLVGSWWLDNSFCVIGLVCPVLKGYRVYYKYKNIKRDRIGEEQEFHGTMKRYWRLEYYEKRSTTLIDTNRHPRRRWKVVFVVDDGLAAVMPIEKRRVFRAENPSSRSERAAVTKVPVSAINLKKKKELNGESCFFPYKIGCIFIWIMNNVLSKWNYHPDKC